MENTTPSSLANSEMMSLTLYHLHLDRLCRIWTIPQKIRRLPILAHTVRRYPPLPAPRLPSDRILTQRRTPLKVPG